MKIESMQEWINRQEKTFGKKIADEILQEVMQGDIVFVEEDSVTFKQNMRYLKDGDELFYDGNIAEYAKLAQDGKIQTWFSFTDEWAEWADENKFDSFDEIEKAFQKIVWEYLEWEKEI